MYTIMRHVVVRSDPPAAIIVKIYIARYTHLSAV